MNENTINNDVTMDGRASVLAGRYRIIRQLGQGGMGSVWLAEDTQLDGKHFAVKMLPSILVANKRAYNQLKSEALVAMKLVHPNIVQIRAFEENDGNPFLVMDYIEGQTLDDWLGDRGQESGVREVWPGRSPLCGAKSQEACERPREPHQESGVSEEEVVRLLKPIAEALDYAHTEGIVHRDIKPANVMIRKDGRPFIMDFGIAREIQETMTRVTGKMSSGTLMYMSPEQLNGDMPKPSQDVYSFAAMVYECLKGEPPFCRGNIEYQIMNKAPEPLTYGRASVPAHGRASVLASRDQELGVRGLELGGRASRPVIADSVIAGLAKNPGDRPKCCVKVLGFGDFGSEKSGIEDSNRVDDVKAKHGDVRHNEDNDPSCETLFEKDVGQADMPRVNASSLSNVDGDRRVSLIGLIILLGLVGFGLFAVIVWWPPAASNRNRKDVSSSASATAEGLEGVPPSRPEGPRESDVTGIAYEAEAQSNIIERIDGADGFNSKKDVLSRLLTTAVAYRKKNSWAYAAVTFTNYVEGCKVLIKLDGERKIAKEKHSAALASQMQAEKVESSKYASARWGAASDVMKKANEHFSQMEFSEAEGFYASAAKQFELCVGEAKTERERQVKERIRRAKWRKEGASYTIEPDGLNLTMKWCPAGSFMMGSPASEAGRKGDEVLHNVTLTKGYWLGETEVTQGQWKRIMDNETVADLVRKGLYDDALCVWNGSKFVTLRESWNIEQNADPMSRCGDLNDNIPVYNLSWYEAVEFCKRLTKLEREAGRIPDGYEYRLPTESEWEYACRAGTTAALPNGRDMKILGGANAPSLDDIAWYSGNSSVGFNGRGVNTSDWKEKQYSGGLAFVREVKGKQPNNWGFYDMIGNVSEWCYDIYGGYSDNITDPVGASLLVGINRVLRGGSCFTAARFCRSAQRAAEKPHYRRYDVGFRVALAPSHPGMIYPGAPVITVPKEDEKDNNFRLAKDAFTAKRYDEAYRLLMKSDLENKEVQYFLGRMYANGQGVQKNEYEAVKWYRKAAEQGHFGAQNNLGIMYKGGHGLTKDDYEAVKWFRKSAEQGEAMAQCSLGNMYKNGQGVPKDDYEAVKWYRKASDQGHPIGHERLGLMYVLGRGVEKNDYEAIRLFRLAAGKFPPAQYSLGWMHENGRGCVKDLEMAKQCYEKAASKGVKEAKEALERLANVKVVKPVKYVQPVASQPQQPVLIDRPLNLKYCDNCGNALWHRKKISTRCEKCGAILFTPEAPQNDTTGKDVEALGNLLRGIGGGL